MLDKKLFQKQLLHKNNPLLDKAVSEQLVRKSHLGKEYDSGMDGYYVLLEGKTTSNDKRSETDLKVVIILEEEFDKYKLSKLMAYKTSTLMPIVELIVNDEI